MWDVPNAYRSKQWGLRLEHKRVGARYGTNPHLSMPNASSPARRSSTRSRRTSPGLSLW